MIKRFILLLNNGIFKPAYTAKFFAGQQAGSRSSAKVIAPIVLDAVQAKTMIDVGSGVGTWSAEFLARGVQVTALDGDYVRPEDLQIPRDRFKPIDLNQPPAASSLGSFDLAICLEVAEHLPADSAERLVAFLTGLAPHVLFSAAIPGQGGHGHINERWQSYWVDLFSEHKFVCNDIVRPAVWASPEVRPWYAQNTFLFTKAERSDLPPSPLPIDIVHPRTFLGKHKNKSLRRLLPQLRQDA